MQRTSLQLLISTGALVAVLLTNILANSLPINGLTTREISALYPSLFTPAGITFSIWGFIYLFLIGFIAMQWMKKEIQVPEQLSKLFWLTCLFNVTWILSWHYLLPGLSVLIMFMLLVALVKIFLIEREMKFTTFVERAFIRFPFTLYFAWICVATMGNIAAFLLSVGWDGGFFTEGTWTVMMMMAVTGLSLYIMLRFHAQFFCIVIIWALFGIFLRWTHTEHRALANAAMAMIIVNAVMLLYSVRKQLLRYVGLTEG
ncbi:MAG: tryptophan-rich sensory protein [Flammeovirgaceae bacterium]|nr:tryptophan-rich sensory protein [Flammeovirgaceae bacterium]